MEHETSQRRFESVFSSKVRAGRRRTYFFDVRRTKGDDFYITLTESTRRYNGDGYERHKIFLYKEDFNRFLDSLKETIDYVKTELMPDYDYDEFTRKQEEWEAAQREQENTNHRDAPKVASNTHREDASEGDDDSLPLDEADDDISDDDISDEDTSDDDTSDDDTSDDDTFDDDSSDDDSSDDDSSDDDSSDDDSSDDDIPDDDIPDDDNSEDETSDDDNSEEDISEEDTDDDDTSGEETTDAIGTEDEDEDLSW